jgi:hypothetical protein
MQVDQGVTMRNGFLLAVVCALVPANGLAQDVGGCNAILELATRESYNEVNAAASFKYNRDNFCSVMEQSKSGNTAVDTAGAYMKVFSGSASYSTQNAEYAYQMLCKGNQSVEAAERFLSIAKSTVNTSAIEAWKTCKTLHATGLRYSAIPQYDNTRGGMAKLTVTLGWVEGKSPLSIKKVVPKNLSCIQGSVGEHFFTGVYAKTVGAKPLVLNSDSASLVCSRSFLSSPTKRNVRGKDVYVIAEVASVDIETDRGTFTHDFAPALVNDLPPFDDTLDQLKRDIALLKQTLKETEAKIPTHIEVVADPGHNNWQNTNQHDFKCTSLGNRVMIAGAVGTMHNNFSTWCGTLVLKK